MTCKDPARFDTDPSFQHIGKMCALLMTKRLCQSHPSNDATICALLHWSDDSIFTFVTLTLPGGDDQGLYRAYMQTLFYRMAVLILLAVPPFEEPDGSYNIHMVQ